MNLPSFFAACRRLLLLVSVVFLLPLSAAGRDIVIGQSIDLSGPQGDIGKDYLAGAKVYFDYINANGGINGRRISHLAVDNQGSAERSQQITRDFLGRQRVDALFGYFGQDSVEGVLHNGELKRAKVAVVAPLSGIDAGPEADNVFFVRASYATEARKLVEYFVAQKITRFAAVYARNSYGNASLAAVENELKNRRLSLMSKHAVGQDGAEIDAAAKAIATANPQAIIVVLETLPAAQFVRAYRQLDKAAYILGLSLVNPVTLFELAGQDAGGTMLAQVVPHPRDWQVPVVMEHEKIMKTYRDEAPSYISLEGFIAAKLLVGALKSASREATPEQILLALKETRKLDVGGFALDFSAQKNRGSGYVDINLLNRKGRMMH